MLVIADDWSPIAGCYGNEVIRTPHIDGLAAQGTVFDRAFCCSPSCAVSRATILTGLHVHTHGQYGHCQTIHGFRTHEHVQSIPRVLRRLGFKTACIGKKHVEPSVVYPFEHEDLAGANSATGQATVDFLQRIGDAPFYVHVAPTYPHRVGQAYGLENQADDFEDMVYDPSDVIVPEFLPDIPPVRQDLANYYGAISRYDQCVGAQLRALEASGRAAETLVLVMTDHGMPFPSGKACSFDSGHHSPLIMRQPGQPRCGVRCQALVDWTCVAPTVYDWCGIPHEDVPEDLPGRSLLPILDQDNPSGWDRVIFSHCFHEITGYFPYRVLRGCRYKYVRNLAYPLKQAIPGDLFRSISWQGVVDHELQTMGKRPLDGFLHRDREQLFDFQEDPLETTNRFDDPALADVVAEMRRELFDFRIRTHDPWLEIDFQEGESAAPDISW